MSQGLLLTALAFVSGNALVIVGYYLVGGHNRRLEDRLKDMPGTGGAPAKRRTTMAEFTRSTLPRLGSPLKPTDAEELSKIKKRMLVAGLYGRHTLNIFLGVKMIMMMAPLVVALIAVVVFGAKMQHGLIGGLVGSAGGMVLPGMWLDKKKKAYQTALRRALPDALDMLCLCLEGGMSMPAAMQICVAELRVVHPILVGELDIVQREMQLGRSAGESLTHLADRCDLEEVRSMASTVLQSERLGASLIKSLRINADVLREKRIQRAEELAQKAATKIVFPTIFCIFPSIFVVILGPAVIHVGGMFAKLK